MLRDVRRDATRALLKDGKVSKLDMKGLVCLFTFRLEDGNVLLKQTRIRERTGWVSLVKLATGMKRSLVTDRLFTNSLEVIASSTLDVLALLGVQIEVTCDMKCSKCCTVFAPADLLG